MIYFLGSLKKLYVTVPNKRLCGGTHVKVEFKSNHLSCVTGQSGPFYPGKTLDWSTNLGNCESTKMNLNEDGISFTFRTEGGDNWCPGTLTAVFDEHVKYEIEIGNGNNVWHYNFGTTLLAPTCLHQHVGTNMWGINNLASTL